MIVPKVLLVPTSLAVTASQLTRDTNLETTTANTVSTTGNPHAGRFTAATSPWLENSAITGYSAAAWFLFADPADVAAIEVAFLDGKQVPTVESSDLDFNQLGLQWRVFFDFGVAMQDTRAALRSKGSA